MHDIILYVLGLDAMELSFRTKAENLLIKLKRSSFMHLTQTYHKVSSAYHPTVDYLPLLLPTHWGKF